VTVADDNCAKIAHLYEAFESEGPAGAAILIEQTFDPDVEFATLQHGSAGGATYRGFEGMAAFFAELHGELSDVTYEPPQCHPVREDAVIAFTRILGSDRHTSVPVRQDLALVYEFSGGTVRRVTAYETPADALEAVERGHADA
jgi:ketosteroid isomerase-like protein